MGNLELKWSALHSSNEAITFIVDQAYYLKTSYNEIDQSNRNNPEEEMQKKEWNAILMR